MGEQRLSDQEHTSQNHMIRTVDIVPNKGDSRMIDGNMPMQVS